MSVAALPMYDWPEIRPATDRLWAACRDALRAAGLTAPDRLDRANGLAETWTRPDLVLGQTCGLPLVRQLQGRVTLLGAWDFGLPGCPPGWYRSAVIVRRSAPGTSLEAFRDATVAINGRNSQSGYASLVHHAAPLAREGRFFGSARVTGSHAASAALVAEGGADIAALDAVSWRLVQRHRPEAASLRVLMQTDPTPGLPLIAAAGADPSRYRPALAQAAARLDPETRAALGLEGFVPFDPTDYAIIAARLAAETRLRL